MTFPSVLLIEDDEDDFRLTQALLQEAADGPISLDWESSYQPGLASLLDGQHDIALIDYRLGRDNGVELLRAARARGCRTPLIMLTGDNDGRLDKEAMAAGADDYLVKGQVTAPLLERSLRYALEHRRVLELLKQREAHLRAVIDNSSDVIALLDPDGTVLFVSNAIERLVGYAANQIVGRSTFELIHPDDQPRIRAASAECLAAPGNRIHAEYRARHRDGTWRDWEVIAVNRLDNPAVRAVILNYRDITDRKREAVRSDLLATIVESSDDAILGTSLDGLVVSWNPGAARLYGYAAEEMIGQPVALLAPPDQPDEEADILAHLKRGEHRNHFETVRLAKDGRRIDVSMTISPLLNELGAIIGKSSIARDITARKQADLQLRDATERLRAVFASAPLAIWALDCAGVFTLSEGQLLTKLGVQPGALVGRTLLDLFTDSPDAAGYARRAISGESLNAEITVGGIIMDIWYSPIRDTGGGLVGTIGVALDVTARHHLEDQFRQAQKMEAVGQLAGGIAHDFNNLLTAILGFGDLALVRLPPGSGLREDVQQILDAAHRAVSLTRQLLAFSRKQILEPAIIDLNTLVEGMQTLLRRLIGEAISLVTTLGDGPSQINADRGQIEQVIMNLAVNARDAMVSGGTLHLATTCVHVDDAFTVAHPGATAGPHVRLTVRDTGTGMSPDVLAHLFEPFFTTKLDGKGTGLGLATVYGIVQQSGGYIAVDSKPGEGTAFTIDLPLVEGVLGTRVGPIGDARGAAGTETILVVEDQQEVRDVIRHTLRRHGYRVLEAADGYAALALLRAGAGRIDLLLADVVMPHMGGRELADEVVRQDPSVRVLFTSGYTDGETLRGVLDSDVAFIQKPFTPAQLLALVRSALGRPKPPAPLD